MSHVAWSVCVCVLGTRVSCAKTAEPIEMPFGGLTHVGPSKYVLMGLRSDLSVRRHEGRQDGNSTFCQIILDTRHN